jgi:glycosyltransferase involved in cell wall biosynthesis
MNILLINHYAGSPKYGMEYRPYYLAREWVDMGHSVTIAASSVSHVRTTAPLVNGAVTQEVVDGIRYLWVKTSTYNGNGIRRVINIFAFIGQLLFRQKWLAENVKPDVVIASSTYPLDIIPASAIARRTHAKLIYEVHDIWPLSLIELGSMSKYHPFAILLQWAENFAYFKADFVVSILPNAMEHMQQHGMAMNKFIHIPNGIVVSEWQDALTAISNDQIRDVVRLKDDGRFLVGYAGAHGLANALEHFVDAADRLKDYPVTFVLIGQGPEKEKLIQKVKDRQQTNVLFLSPVEKKAMPAILKHLDVLYIGLIDNPSFKFGVSPNKLMDYLMAARPIIYAINAGNDIVAESGCGISINPEKPSEIVEATLSLMKMSPEIRDQMGQKGKEYVMANHDYRILAQRFVERFA